MMCNAREKSAGASSRRICQPQAGANEEKSARFKSLGSSARLQLPRSAKRFCMSNNSLELCFLSEYKSVGWINHPLLSLNTAKKRFLLRRSHEKSGRDQHLKYSFLRNYSHGTQRVTLVASEWCSLSGACAAGTFPSASNSTTHSQRPTFSLARHRMLTCAIRTQDGSRYNSSCCVNSDTLVIENGIAQQLAVLARVEGDRESL
jgi:hypothetical protein